MHKRTPPSSGYYATMVLDTGEHINIKCPENSQDELLDSLGNAMKLGTAMERVNMRRVVGMV
jgi:hypothetical protein